MKRLLFLLVFVPGVALAGIEIDGGNASMGSPAVGFTAGRVPYVDSSGNWANDADFTFNGSTVAVTTMTVSARLLAPSPSAETIADGGTITADGCGGIKRVTAAGEVTTGTTNTFTAPGAVNTGCVMFVCNSGANTINLDDNANFQAAASGNVALTAEDCVTVGSDGAIWRQLAPILSGN